MASHPTNKGTLYLRNTITLIPKGSEADDTPLIQAAYDKLFDHGGGTITLAEGTFHIKSSIKPKWGVNIKGVGGRDNATRLNVYAQIIAFDCSAATAANQSIQGCRFSDFTLIAVTNGQGIGFHCASTGQLANQFILENVRFWQLLAGSTTGASNVGFFDCQIRNCQFNHCVTGWTVSGTGTTISNCYFGSCKTQAVRMKKPDSASFGIGVTLNDCIFAGGGTTQYCIRVDDICNNITCNNTWFETFAVAVISAPTISAHNIDFNACTIQPSTGVGADLLSITSTSITGKITFNRCIYWRENGTKIYPAQDYFTAKFHATDGLLTVHDCIYNDNSSASHYTSATQQISGLTASQAVVTNAASELASLEYTSADNVSTIMSRDGTGKSEVKEFVITGLTASQAIVTDANKKLTSMEYASTAFTASTLVQRDGFGNIKAKMVDLHDQTMLQAPIFTTRSTGTRVLINANISGTNVDYAIGITAGAMWFSIREAISAVSFKWYAGVSERMALHGDGILRLLANVTSTNTASGSLVVTGGVGISGALHSGTASITNAFDAGSISSDSTINAALGSVAAPSYTFTGEATTGISCTSDGVMIYSTNGVERMRIHDSAVIVEPSIQLTANGGVNSNLFTSLDDGSAVAPIFARDNDSGMFFEYNGTADSYDVALCADNVERFRIAADTGEVALNGRTVLASIYLPEIAALTNVEGSQTANAKYMRIGDIIFVSGSAGINPTGAGAMLWSFTLPVTKHATAPIGTGLWNSREANIHGFVTSTDAGAGVLDFATSTGCDAPNGNTFFFHYHFSYLAASSI